jgi:hypothetical protein
VLLGTWLAADCVPGRAGSILEQQQLPAGSSAAAVLAAARAMAAHHFGEAAAARVPGALPGGPAKELLIYDYGNERRGGEVVSGGALAYWDGQNVVGLVEVNTTESGGGASQIPYHPIEPAHVTAVQALAATIPHVAVSDSRVQARLLSAPSSGQATVMAANRWDSDAEVVLRVALDGRQVRLPSRGSVSLPAGAAMLMPIGYQLGNGVQILIATAQLTGAEVSGYNATLDLWTPAGGEATVRLPAPPISVTLDGKPVTAERRGRRTVRVTIPAGDHELTLDWQRLGRFG